MPSTARRSTTSSKISSLRAPKIILALVDEGGIEFGGKVFDFSEKDSLLNAADYQDHAAYFNHLMATVG